MPALPVTSDVKVSVMLALVVLGGESSTVVVGESSSVVVGESSTVVVGESSTAVVGERSTVVVAESVYGGGKSSEDIF